MNVKLITPPTQEPVTLEQAKAHLRLEESRDDAYVQVLITAARQYIEKICWRGLLLQTWEMELGGFRGADRFEILPAYAIGRASDSRFQPYLELPRGHLSETPNVTINYFNAAGDVILLPADDYQVDSSEDRNGRLWMASGWPDTESRFDAVKVRYQVGWSTPEDVPAPLVHAVKLLISQMYEYRTPEVTGTIATMLSFTIDALTMPYRFAGL